MDEAVTGGVLWDQSTTLRARITNITQACSSDHPQDVLPALLHRLEILLQIPPFWLGFGLTGAVWPWSFPCVLLCGP